MSNCWLELRYDYGPRDVPLDMVDNPWILRMVKAYLLTRQEQIARKARQMDELLGISEEEELSRLRKVLDMAIPGDIDAIHILDGINSDGNGQKE